LLCNLQAALEPGPHVVPLHYFNGMTADRHHLLNSVTKSALCAPMFWGW
jgi:hypothetical protein